MRPNTAFGTFETDNSLAGAVNSAVSNCDAEIGAKQLIIRRDVSLSALRVDCSAHTSVLIDRMLLRAVSNAPCGSEIEICVIATAHGWEVEVADEGSDADCCAAFQTSLDGAQHLGSTSPEIQCLRCPQGGVSWKLIIPTRQRSVLVA